MLNLFWPCQDQALAELCPAQLQLVWLYYYNNILLYYVLLNGQHIWSIPVFDSAQLNKTSLQQTQPISTLPKRDGRCLAKEEMDQQAGTNKCVGVTHSALAVLVLYN